MVIGGLQGFKALPLLGAKLCPQALLLAKESSRGGEWEDGELQHYIKKKKNRRKGKSFLKI